MRLTQFSDYALRLLIFVAAHPDRRVTIAEAAQSYAISRNHLMKVAQRLAGAGLLKPNRGRGGGLALGRPAEEIMLSDILRVTEPDFCLVGCMAGESCSIADRCLLPGALDEALGAFFAVAATKSLVSLVRDGV